MALTAVGLGACTTIFYCVTILEVPLSKKADEQEQKYQKAISGNNTATLGVVMNKSGGKTPKEWLGESQFYLFGMVYMFARLALNMTATFTPLYLTSVTGFVTDGGTSPVIASVPLSAYVFSLLFSVFAQAPITQKFRNRFIPMLMAAVVTTASSVPFLFLSEDSWDKWLVYPLASV